MGCSIPACSASSVYSWTKELREKEKQKRDAQIARLRDEGKSTREIADEVDIDHVTVARALQNSKTGILQHNLESQVEPEIEPPKVETAEEQEAAEPELEPAPPEPIPEHILKTARAVMAAFAETRPDEYVARLEASPSEWMTITDDSLSNELERELLTSAAAMCLWQEWMVWYQGENASEFANRFGQTGPVFVRGESGQWSIVSRLRSILRRLWT